MVNFNYSKITDLTALKTAIKSALDSYDTTVGATRGGCTFSAIPTIRQREADGKRYEYVGSKVIDIWAVKLIGTLIEIVPGNIARVLATGEVTENEAKTIATIKTRTELKDSDYIKTLTWVGDTSQGAMMITLYNALNTNGATLTINDKGEGTLPFEFVAHQGDAENTEFAPYEIVFLNPAHTA